MSESKINGFPFTRQLGGESLAKSVDGTAADGGIVECLIGFVIGHEGAGIGSKEKIVMQAFGGNDAIKQDVLTRLRTFERAEAIQQFSRWNATSRVGGAVACTLERDDPVGFRTDLGLPIWLAHVEDWIFNRMAGEKSLTFPRLVMDAIPVGANIDRCVGPFLAAVLSPLINEIRAKRIPSWRASLDTTIALFRRDDVGSRTWCDHLPLDQLVYEYKWAMRQWTNESPTKVVTVAVDMLANTLTWSDYVPGAITNEDRAGAATEDEADSRCWERLMLRNTQRAYDIYADTLLEVLRIA